MISYAVKSLDSNPIMSSTLLLSIVYALSIAPNFTDDPYLKLLPVFLIPAVMIASSDTTGFAMNVELIMASGIITAGFIKLLTLNKDIRERLKRPQEQKVYSSILYVGIFAFFMSMYALIGTRVDAIALHAPQPQQKSAFYFLLVFLYVVITLASITGFRLGFGKEGNSKSDTSEVVYVDRTITSPREDDPETEDEQKMAAAMKRVKKLNKKLSSSMPI